MVGLFVAPCLLAFWLFQELELRKRAGLEPANLKQLWILSNKSKSSDRRRASLCFALIASLMFSFWEGALRALLDRPVYGVLEFAGALLLCAAIYIRRRDIEVRKAHLSQVDLAWLWFGWALLLHAWLSLIVFSIWLVVRSRFLGIANIAIVFLLLVPLARPALAVDATCVEHVEKFLGRSVKYKTYKQVEGENLKHGRLLLSKMFPGDGQVVLGLEPHGHFYLVADGARFDGDPFTYVGRRHAGPKGELAVGAPNSALVRFPNLPEKVVDGLRASISNKKDNLFMLSCIDGVCQLANREGLQINDVMGTLGRALLPGASFERILESGFRLKESHTPVEIEVYLPEGWTLEKLIEHHRKRDTELPKEFAKGAAGKFKKQFKESRKAQVIAGGVGVIMIAGTTVVMVRSDEPNDSDQGQAPAPTEPVQSQPSRTHEP